MERGASAHQCQTAAPHWHPLPTLAPFLRHCDGLQSNGGKVVSNEAALPCPACRELGSDKSGDHLTVFASGKFSCALHPGDKEHNRRIIELMPHLGRHDATSPPRESNRPISHPGTSKTPSLGPIIEIYPYHDQEGKIVYEVRRYDPKDFRPYRIVDGMPVLGLEGVTAFPTDCPKSRKRKRCGLSKEKRTWAPLRLSASLPLAGQVERANGKTSLRLWFKDKDVVLCGDDDKPGRDYMDKVEAMLKPLAKSIKRVIVPEPSKDISDHLAGMSQHEAHAAVEELLSVPDPFDMLLDTRRSTGPSTTKPVPVLLIDGKPIATSGNLMSVTAQAKAGKTAAEGAMAALMEPTGDCLGITGQNPEGLPVLHFDTEQSPFDHHAVVLLALGRAGRAQPPLWFRSYLLGRCLDQ